MMHLSTLTLVLYLSILLAKEGVRMPNSSSKVITDQSRRAVSLHLSPIRRGNKESLAQRQKYAKLTCVEGYNLTSFTGVLQHVGTDWPLNRKPFSRGRCRILQFPAQLTCRSFKSFKNLIVVDQRFQLDCRGTSGAYARCYKCFVIAEICHFIFLRTLCSSSFLLCVWISPICLLF